MMRLLREGEQQSHLPRCEALLLLLKEKSSLPFRLWHPSGRASPPPTRQMMRPPPPLSQRCPIRRRVLRRQSQKDLRRQAPRAQRPQQRRGQCWGSGALAMPRWRSYLPSSFAAPPPRRESPRGRRAPAPPLGVRKGYIDALIRTPQGPPPAPPAPWRQRRSRRQHHPPPLFLPLSFPPPFWQQHLQVQCQSGGKRSMLPLISKGAGAASAPPAAEKCSPQA